MVGGMVGGIDENAGFSGKLESSSGQQQLLRARPTPGRFPTCPQVPQQQPPATEDETAAQKSATYAKANRAFKDMKEHKAYRVTRVHKVSRALMVLKVMLVLMVISIQQTLILHSH
jgi:hypothetical protein